MDHRAGEGDEVNVMFKLGDLGQAASLSSSFVAEEGDKIYLSRELCSGDSSQGSSHSSRDPARGRRARWQ